MRSGRLVGAAETSKKLAEWRRLQQRNLSILGLLRRKCGFSATEREREQLASTPEPHFQKEKEQSCQSRAPDRERGGSQGEREPHLGETGRSEQEDIEERVDSTMKEGRF